MLFQRMSLSASGAFCRRMGTGLRAGVDVIRLLESESKYGTPKQRDILSQVLEQVIAGFQVSEAMTRQGSYFPSLMISLIRAGEVTGSLEKTFLTLADHFEQRVSLRREFVSSITFPIVMLMIGLGVISLFIFLLGYLTPVGGGEMTDMLGLGLRGPSGVLIFWGYLACIAALLWAAYFGYQRNLGGVQNLVPVLYMVPKLGPSLQTITLSRFARTLALAMGSGLDPFRSVSLSLDSTDSDYYRSGAPVFEAAIRDRGDTLSGALRSTDLFPDTFLQLVEVAELSGTESESIDHLANDYEERAKMAMKALAGVATLLITLTYICTMVFFIIRIFMNISGAYSEALDMVQ